MDTQHFKLGRAIEFWMSQGYRQEEEEDKKGRRDCNNSFLMKKEFLDDTKTGRLWQPWACENVLEICALIFTQQNPWLWSLDVESPPFGVKTCVAGREAGPLAGSRVTPSPHWSHPLLCSYSLFFLSLLFLLLLLLCIPLCLCLFFAPCFVLSSSFPSSSISPVTSFLPHQYLPPY